MKKTHTSIALIAVLAASTSAWSAVSKKSVLALGGDAREPREFQRTSRVPVQKYDATENDGTAELIRPNMRPDENKPAEVFFGDAEAALPAPKVTSKRVTREDIIAEQKAAPTPAPSPSPAAIAAVPQLAPSPAASPAPAAAPSGHGSDA